jgi:hypothetical protein
MAPLVDMVISHENYLPGDTSGDDKIFLTSQEAYKLRNKMPGGKFAHLVGIDVLVDDNMPGDLEEILNKANVLPIQVDWYAPDQECNIPIDANALKEKVRQGIKSD